MCVDVYWILTSDAGSIPATSTQSSSLKRDYAWQVSLLNLEMKLGIIGRRLNRR